MRRTPHRRSPCQRSSPTEALGDRARSLSRVSGALVQVLDHDDLLLPHALATMIRVFDDSRIGWAVGQADDLTPDGRREEYPSDLPYGHLKPGQVNDWAIDHQGNWPVHCAGLMIRTHTLRAVGGWMALPADDDIGMFSALSELHAGYNEPTTTWLYRKHPHQTHKLPAWQAWSDVGRRAALQRIAAIRGTSGEIVVGAQAKASHG